jgi:predicted RNA binding protein YcfA (HicA-like mRNA interferase family)
LADGFYKTVIQELKKLGFSKLPKKGKGSHELWENDETGRTVLVPRNLKSRHTANGILSDAGSHMHL